MKNPEIFLRHILDSINEIENYTRNFDSKRFLKAKQTQDAVIRRLEIIGEAVKNLSKPLIMIKAAANELLDCMNNLKAKLSY